MVLFIKDEMSHNDKALVKDLWNDSEIANLDKVMIFVKLVSLVKSVTNIFKYSNIFDLNIYSDIRSYHFLDTNIFGYSFVSTFFI